ncbi:hypothetical protein MACH24_09370 [Erythrobacter sp. Dej080120_24]|nr:hypothetical protein MACH24_09370 [Erythrobacter sp. Dej080120_24]
MDQPEHTVRTGNDPFSPRIAALVAGLALADLDDEAIRAARIFLADTLATGIAGTCNPGADGLLAALVAAAPGGHVACLGRRGVALAPYDAALVNGFQIHCLEWDGLHEPSVVIALCATMGALTCEIQQRDVSLGEWLVAFVAGVETAVFFGSASASAPRFFRPSAAGVMGAGAAVGKLRGFDETQMLDLLGLAYSQAGGTMQAHWEGSEALALQVGCASRAALTAADLVQHRLTGPHDFVSGKFGYFALFEAPGDLEGTLGTWGRPWKICEVAHKPYPAGRATQSVITALIALRERHGFGADDVAELRADVPSLIGLLVGRPYRPDMSPSYARLCLQYVAPLILRDGVVDPRKFTSEWFADPQIAALAARVRCHVDDNPNPNALGPQLVTVTLRDGTELREHVAVPLGAPGNPLSAAQRIDKIERCFAAAGWDGDAGGFMKACETLPLEAPARAVLAALERKPQ